MVLNYGPKEGRLEKMFSIVFCGGFGVTWFFLSHCSGVLLQLCVQKGKKTQERKEDALHHHQLPCGNPTKKSLTF
jgi:hypothetical protein